jgi:DNA-binding NarL/FixJ family response regulator
LTAAAGTAVPWAAVRRVRVVVADNDTDALDLVATDLALEGHDVVGTARDGEQALELCEALRPDVLVTDYRMPPGPDGVKVARRVRAAGTVGRVIVYSNYRDPKIVRAVERAGAAFLEKGNLMALRRAVADGGDGGDEAPLASES